MPEHAPRRNAGTMPHSAKKPKRSAIKRTASSPTVGFRAKTSLSGRSGKKQHSLYSADVEALYPDPHPSDISFCSTAHAPTRLRTYFEDDEKAHWCRKEDASRFHLPRSMTTAMMHLAATPAMVAARRVSGRSRNTGWSFRDETTISWLHFALGTQNHKQWRNLMTLGAKVMALKASSSYAKPVDEPGIRGYWIDDLKGMPVAEKDIVWLYFHGGGYLAGEPIMHLSPYRKILSMLRKRHHICNVRILTVRYPLAPEHCYPAQVNVAYDAYQWLTKVHKTSADKIIVGGDSAGGNLTLALLQRIRSEGAPMPRLAVLMSPWVEMLLTIPNGMLNVSQLHADVLSARVSRPAVLAFLGTSGVDPADPMVSPVNMDFTGMPPMVVQWGGLELFSLQIREFCSRAEDAGIRVLRDADPDMFHIYQMMVDIIGARGVRGLERLSTMIATMIVEEMGSDGRGGGPGPRPRDARARSLRSVKSFVSLRSTSTNQSNVNISTSTLSETPSGALVAEVTCALQNATISSTVVKA
ncbi:alpha/beta hydrolase fold-domain-containing protein [Thamnocephalis sphaerospora]|uniref:Alpha/beta hydrolase fold-domain-containing protein n=1 Tax=Thamnocephalis sphaerospora TaxID=78915 RepID=A0A4P9XWS7_9FUNG|nr:alpha/beta hydrolase fold-domain-containing protein [Thamnocephalis sphaerospora]|eukprot:RKP10786.1 alpha/beta hydrolase fold-domain-containing protein [Thamnocephalis sphaerospora]